MLWLLNQIISSHAGNALMIQVPESEVQISTSRSSGPGGQHVNKTSSRVTLHWNLSESVVLSEEQKSRCLEKLKNRINQAGEIVLHVDLFRSQLLNKEQAYERLNAWVNEALLVPKKRVKTKISRAAKARRLDNKKRNAQQKNLRRQAF